MNTPNKKEEIKVVFYQSPEGNITPRPAVKGQALLEIPPGVYSLVYEDGMHPQVYLRPENDFTMPTRVYGNSGISEMVDRFFKSFEMRAKNLGVTLIGEKGSGKTLMLKAMSQKAKMLSMAVILVDEVIPGGVLNYVLSSIEQPILVNFDEFEKTYEDKDDQTAILKLLDGTNTGNKKMYCFTINDRTKVSEYMFGRPSRVRYVLPFKRLESSTVVDYVTANLKNFNEDHLRAYLHVALCESDSSQGLNFDSMVEFVEEMNMFGGDLGNTLELMGSHGTKGWSYFEVTAFEDHQMVFRTVADGHHEGPYVGKDDMEITMNIQTLATAEEMLAGNYGRLKTERLVLTREDFVGFGDAYDVLLFKKDGISYNLRYASYKSKTRFKNDVEEDLGKQSRDVLTKAVKASLNPSNGQPEVLMPEPVSRINTLKSNSPTSANYSTPSSTSTNSPSEHETTPSETSSQEKTKSPQDQNASNDGDTPVTGTNG